MATAAEIIAIARTLTNQDGTAPVTNGQVTDAQLLPVLAARYQAMRRALGQLVPTLYHVVAPSFVIVSGNSYDTAAAGLSQFSRVYRLQHQVGTGSGAEWYPLAAANPLDPEIIPDGHEFAFLERGAVLDFYPATRVPGQTFRLAYIQKPAPLTVLGTAVDVPEGAEYILAQQLAHVIRGRMEEDPGGHKTEADEQWKELKWYLRQRYGLHSEAAIPESRR